MQIEDANIPVEAKAELLNAPSKTGIKDIIVGSFVSHKYTRQLKNIEAVFDLNGSWPWKEAFFPKVEDLQQAGVVPAANQKGKAA